MEREWWRVVGGIVLLILGVAWAGLVVDRWRKLRVGVGRIFGGIGSAILLITGISLMASSGHPATPANAPAARSHASSSVAPPKAKSGATAVNSASQATAKPAVPLIGQQVDVGNWSYMVQSVSTAQAVGDTADGFGDTASGEYVIVAVSAMYGGKDAGTLDSSMLKLTPDGGKTTYSSDFGATTDINPAGKGLFLETANPGVQIDGKLAYDVPAGTDPSALEMQVSNGFLATKTAFIALHK